MSRIRSKNTNPEKVVRTLLHSQGYRFRLHLKGLPGKPDIVLKKYNTVILVNGCFWHQHKSCKRANIPKSNKEYWIPKIERNKKRDKRNIKEIKSLGWRVMVLWECEIKKSPQKIVNKVMKFLEK